MNASHVCFNRVYYKQMHDVTNARCGFRGQLDTAHGKVDGAGLRVESESFVEVKSIQFDINHQTAILFIFGIVKDRERE